MVACLAGLLSFWGRVGAQDDNVFAQVQQYAATSIPAHAVVVADEAIGDLIAQPYCREQQADPCLGRRLVRDHLGHLPADHLAAR